VLQENKMYGFEADFSGEMFVQNLMKFFQELKSGTHLTINLPSHLRMEGCSKNEANNLINEYQ
jgi:hypothetical protein